MMNQTIDVTPQVTINENVNNKLDKVYQKIMSLDREDYSIPANELRARIGDDKKIYFDARDLSWSPTDYAIGQLCDRESKGLRSFTNELLTKDEKYQQVMIDAINGMLEREPDKRRFQARTIKPNGERIVRAFTSDIFKNIDCPVLVPTIVDLVSQKADTWRALGGQITDTRTYIKFMTRNPVVFDIGPNKRNWHIGFMYSNSEVGAGTTKYNLFAFDSWCENGTAFNAKSIIDVSFVHKGSTMTSDFGLIREERAKQLELEIIRSEIEDKTKFVMRQDFSEQLKLMIESAEAKKLEGDCSSQERQIIQLAQYARLSKSEANHVLTKWHDNEPNVFGVASAITKLAQDQKNYEERMRLENAGGRLMEIPASHWKSILALSE